MAEPERPPCPQCQAPGRRLPPTTPAHLVRDPASLADLAEPFFCATPECELVYFDRAGHPIAKQALRVRVYQKERAADRPVCYCFGHSVAEVREAELLALRLRADDPASVATNAIVKAITLACRAGRDRCDETNPQGRCCLGNVRAAAKERAGQEPVQSPDAPDAPTPSCCCGPAAQAQAQAQAPESP